MKHRTQARLDWLAKLTTRELVIYLLELRRVVDQQPELAAEVEDACVALRSELLQREWPVTASR
ncbi:MAG TPA: hypothetical protein VF157_05430 [Chloroflexota bacterium]